MSLDLRPGVHVPAPAVIGIIAALLIGWGLYCVLAGQSATGPREVHYPYWCRDCKAVYDVGEIKKDYPKNWRIPKSAPSDSVVLCVRCNKGWAFPVAQCPQCAKNYVLHLQQDPRCPVCTPQAAQQATQAGIDLAPPEVKSLKINP